MKDTGHLVVLAYISEFGCGLVFRSFAVPELDELALLSLLMLCWRA